MFAKIKRRRLLRLVLLGAMVVSLCNVGCFSRTVVEDDGGKNGAGMTKIDLGVGILEILIPGARSREFPDGPVVVSVDVTSPDAYDKWGAMTLLENYWDYDRSFTGSSAGTLRVAVRVRAVDTSMKFDPNDVDAFQDTVLRLAVAQAREFAASMKGRSQPAPQVNGPTGIRRQIVGNEEWVAYKRQDGETQIYTRPLDSAHFIEVVISYISNSKNEAWRGRASSDAEKILRSISIIRRRSTG
jgi:hypothetical protein